MLYPIKLYIKNTAMLAGISLSTLINFAMWLWLLLHIHRQTEPIFLRYNILFGVDRIGDWSEIFYLPLVGLMILAFNVIAGWLFFQRDKYLAYFLCAIAALCQGMLLLSVVHLVALNV